MGAWVTGLAGEFRVRWSWWVLSGVLAVTGASCSSDSDTVGETRADGDAVDDDAADDDAADDDASDDKSQGPDGPNANDGEDPAEPGDPGDDPPNPGMNPAVDPSVAANLRDYGAALCRLYERCDSNVLWVYGSSQRCEEVMTLVWSEIAFVEQAPELAEALAGCVDVVDQAPCPESGELTEQFTETLASCIPQDLRQDNRPEGAACDSTNDCADGLLCERPSLAMCGTCQPRVDGECRNSLDCPSRQYCSDAICKELPDVGEPCLSGICRVGYCDETTDLCVASLAEGDACEENVQCQQYQFCQGGVCRRPGAEGDACEGSGPFDCQFLMACHEGTCKETLGVRLELGDLCSSLLSQCADGGYCDSTSQRCEAVLSLGEPCEENNQCGPNGYCDETCHPKAPNGETCVAAANCQSGFCFESVCTESPVCEP